MLPQTASAGLGPLVDETAITLELRPLRRRDRFVAGLSWRVGVAAAVVGFGVTALVLHATRPEPAPRAIDPRTVVAAPPSESEPVLASATPSLERVVAPEEEIVIVDEELQEIEIFDEPSEPPPPRASRASRRGYASTLAREHTARGRTALARGDLLTARRELERALVALPSHAPAAAAMAELHLKHHRYGPAVRLAKRASRSAPRKLDYMVLLGDAYLAAGDRGAARKAWRKAAAYGSTKAESRLAAR